MQEPLAESGVTYAEAFSVVERKSNCRSSLVPVKEIAGEKVVRYEGADIEQASIHFLELKCKSLLHKYLMHLFDLTIC